LSEHVISLHAEMMRHKVTLSKLKATKDITLEESLSITTGRCDLDIATHARKMHKKLSI
jgi:hypothetical protein